jgi:hypothetical protein
MSRVVGAALVLVLATPALAGGAERTARQHARKEAKQLEQLQRSTSREGVPQQAAARYLDRYGHLDTRPVRRVERWAATLPAPAVTASSPPPASDPAPVARPLAVPAEPPVVPEEQDVSP